MIKTAQISTRGAVGGRPNKQRRLELAITTGDHAKSEWRWQGKEQEVGSLFVNNFAISNCIPHTKVWIRSSFAVSAGVLEMIGPRKGWSQTWLASDANGASLATRHTTQLVRRARKAPTGDNTAAARPGKSGVYEQNLLRPLFIQRFKSKGTSCGAVCACAADTAEWQQSEQKQKISLPAHGALDAPASLCRGNALPALGCSALRQTALGYVFGVVNGTGWLHCLVQLRHHFVRHSPPASHSVRAPLAAAFTRGK